MLQQFFVYIWVPLLLLGMPLMVLRPALLFLRRKNPMGPRTKSFLWFFQVLGFWAFLIGAWMILPNLLAPLFEESEPSQKSADEREDSARRASEEKRAAKAKASTSKNEK